MSGRPYSDTPERARDCREKLDIILPALRYRARCCGYALAVHGSLARDIDLVAAPWTKHALSPDALIARLFAVVTAVFGEVDQHIPAPTQQPHGRVSFVIHLTHYYGDGAYLDISVMPPLPEAASEESRPDFVPVRA